MQVAEILGESMGDDSTHGREIRESGEGAGDDDGGGNRGEGEDPDGAGDDTGGEGREEQSFTAAGSTFKGQQLQWSLISRISRAQWEKSMASCCLGIVLQHRYENNGQVRQPQRLVGGP